MVMQRRLTTASDGGPFVGSGLKPLSPLRGTASHRLQTLPAVWTSDMLMPRRMCARSSG